MSKVYDVVINGCGPTGLASALLLARAGHTVAILDRHEAIYPLPRAIAYDHEVARILGVLGLTEAMVPLVATPGVYQWQNQDGELLFELNWGDTVSISGFATSYLFSQPDMEKVLNDAALAEPLIEVMRGVEATSFTQDAEGITLIGQRLSGEAVALRGRWLVGADGANSLVRRALGVALEDLGFRADWLVVDVAPKDGGGGNSWRWQEKRWNS
jgi:2-polyprenyl-6-methoxyphenol hydroxylase-like FAD-dependent oxidoreductase